VDKIHPSRCDVEGFRNTAPGVIQEAAKGAHEPIVPHGGAEECVALPTSEVGAPAKGIVKLGRCMHTATGYKCSVAIARYRDLRRRSASCERVDIGHGSDRCL